jgi:hypothetical protein
MTPAKTPTAKASAKNDAPPASSSAPGPSARVYGIRHHGPGSAKSLLAALKEWNPDCLLVEGPPDAEEALEFVGDKDLQPPVALLVYHRDEPQRCAFYPFAEFSPEWQALKWARERKVAARFMDLPLEHRFGIEDEERAKFEKAMAEAAEKAAQEEAEAAAKGVAPSEGNGSGGNGTAPSEDKDASPGEEAIDEASQEEAEEVAAGFDVDKPSPEELLRSDPLSALAQAAGYADGEEWWEQLVEARGNHCHEVFGGILEAMSAAREHAPFRDTHAGDLMEARREAYMRQTIRAAQKEGFQRIAVVCGAWHAPALSMLPPAKEDEAILKKLPKVATRATWTPWTHGRLASWSGYGAGVRSPGWYFHLWKTKDHKAERWMIKVARTLRDADLDASPASVIESARLADALAALRDRPAPGLPELNEAALTVLCRGDEAPLRLIELKLVVDERLGRVPNTTPRTPLQQDFEKERKRLEIEDKDIVKYRETYNKNRIKNNKRPLEPNEPFPFEIDFRNTKNKLDRDRSFFFKRLKLLSIAWGVPGSADRDVKTTSIEVWRLQWKPEMEVALIEASRWGATVMEAASAYARAEAAKIEKLSELAKLVVDVLEADIKEADTFISRLKNLAAISTDVLEMMESAIELAPRVRYEALGVVRKADVGELAKVVDGLVARICIGLSPACSNLNDDAASAMLEAIINTDREVIRRLNKPEHLETWLGALAKLADRDSLHGLIAGRSARLLLDAGKMTSAEAARRMGLELSLGGDPLRGAAWLEGFLRDSGALLLHDDDLWGSLDGWVAGLHPDRFQEILPLLRRTFSTFATGERRQFGERAKRVGPQTKGVSATGGEASIDPARAKLVLPALMAILGKK